MCLLVFGWQVRADLPFVFVGNRDEFYHRPTEKATFWEDHPKVLAGRDLEAGGTWLGVTKAGKFTAITNHRDFHNIKENAPSRGDLTANYLKGNSAPAEYLESILPEIGKYNGFNLIVGDQHRLYYLNNIDKKVQKLKPGIYGLSNAVLNTPWPKVEKAKEKFLALLENVQLDHQRLISSFIDKETAPDAQLPDTGVSQEWERLLSPMFIESENYGTSITTAMSIWKDGILRFTEYTHPINDSVGNQVEYTVDLPGNWENEYIESK